MFVFVLLVSYFGGEEVIYIVSLIIVCFENIIIFLVCRCCVLFVLMYVDGEFNFWLI